MRLLGASLTSGELTIDQAVTTGSGVLRGAVINTDGNNNATVILYDNASAASGTKLWEQVVIGADITGGFFNCHGIEYNNGIYLDITGSGASVIAFYVQRD
ncbi:MAG: hypothetical protein ACW99U_18310 [Candidatus Thorarchaeota archaeon]|jgi:hypothetical protein